jgi:hypothetical protein
MSNEQKVTRKLKAILSADVKGYSLLMAWVAAVCNLRGGAIGTPHFTVLKMSKNLDG